MSSGPRSPTRYGTPAATGPPAARAGRIRLASWPMGPLPKPTPASSVSKPRVSAISPSRAMTEPSASFSFVAPVISPAKSWPRPCATFVCSVAASSAVRSSTCADRVRRTACRLLRGVERLRHTAEAIAGTMGAAGLPRSPGSLPRPPAMPGDGAPTSSSAPATASRSACSDFSGAVAAPAAAAAEAARSPARALASPAAAAVS